MKELINQFFLSENSISVLKTVAYAAKVETYC